MAIITYPLNNIDYTAEDAELYHATRSSGVFAANEDFPCSVTGIDSTVTIGEGIAWIRNSRFSGKVVANKEPVTLDLGPADMSYPRVDAIVLRFDANANATTLIKKQGVPSSNPVDPELVRTEAVYELHLYHIYRDAGTVGITSNKVNDMRPDPNFCGIMTDISTSVPTKLSQLVNDIMMPVSQGGTGATTASQARANLGVAPAGYGLGVLTSSLPAITTLAELDAVNANGWYKFDCGAGTPIQVSGEYFECAYLRVDTYDRNTMKMTLVPAFPNGANTSTLVRYKVEVDGNWGEWEWENPPMKLGVEYRTTERSNGKAVYAQLRTYGTVPYSDGMGFARKPIGYPVRRIVRFSASAGRTEDNTTDKYVPVYSIPYVYANASGEITNYVYVGVYTQPDKTDGTINIAYKSTPDNGEKLFCTIWYTKE